MYPIAETWTTLGSVVASCAAHCKICADGGANRLRDSLQQLAAEQQLPDAVVGDLDSIRPAVRQQLQQAGVHIDDLSHDQDSTDLEKCLHHLQLQMDAGRSAKQQPHNVVVAIGADYGMLAVCPTLTPSACTASIFLHFLDCLSDW